MVLQQLDATDRQHHADPQAKSQPGAVTWNRHQDMIAIIQLSTFELALLAECLMWYMHDAKRRKKGQQCQAITCRGARGVSLVQAVGTEFDKHARLLLQPLCTSCCI